VREGLGVWVTLGDWVKVGVELGDWLGIELGD
jgi:hypothetical protein